MRFIRGIIILTGVLGMLASLLLVFSQHAVVHPYIWWMLGFFVFITCFTHYISHLGLQRDRENLQVYYYTSMGVRMVFSIIAIFVYRYFTEAYLVQFVLNFFVLYFLYTGFEIWALLSNLRPNSKKQL